MMRPIAVLLICIVALSICLSGCSRESSLEGKIVDGKGEPMAGVKVVAKQALPTDGAEPVEIVTGADGSFKLNKLFPDAPYELVACPPGMAQTMPFKTTSAPEGKTRILPEAVTIRFQFPVDGATVLDTKTGLIWAKDADIAGSGMKYDEAAEWIKRLDIAGHTDWRLPNRSELEEFTGKKTAAYFNAIGFKNVRTDYYWSCDDGFSDGYGWSWSVHMNGYFVNRINKTCDYYVWPVRSGQ